MPPCPPVFGLFQKRIDGDDALLNLARLRFGAAGLGAECYAETISEFEHLFAFTPRSRALPMVHMARWIDILNPDHRRFVADFARTFRGRVSGLVVHDQPEFVSAREAYLAGLLDLHQHLAEADGPQLFIEYACGMQPDRFVELSAELAQLDRIGRCLDTGHLAVRMARDAFAGIHTGIDVCAITPDDPALPGLIDDIDTAVRSAAEGVVSFMALLAPNGGQLHLHLHDGHPLSTASPFGVSDHLGFFDKITIPFSHRGAAALDPFFGPAGLKRLVLEALRLYGADRLSCTLEIHPDGGREPLGDESSLFSHWRDTGNAERMNHWLSVLIAHHEFIHDICREGTTHAT